VLQGNFVKNAKSLMKLQVNERFAHPSTSSSASGEISSKLQKVRGVLSARLRRPSTTSAAIFSLGLRRSREIGVLERAYTSASKELEPQHHVGRDTSAWACS